MIDSLTQFVTKSNIEGLQYVETKMNCSAKYSKMRSHFSPGIPFFVELLLAKAPSICRLQHTAAFTVVLPLPQWQEKSKDGDSVTMVKEL